MVQLDACAPPVLWPTRFLKYFRARLGRNYQIERFHGATLALPKIHNVAPRRASDRDGVSSRGTT
jgi:hypothetical protein